jgi:hypothetical protein
MTSQLETRIKSSLEKSTQQIDNDTRQRLFDIRNQALKQPQQTNWFSVLQSNYWMPATGIVLCSFIAALLLWPQWQRNGNTTSFEQTAMFELIDNPEEIDVLSDPDFYLWIDELEAQNV